MRMTQLEWNQAKADWARLKHAEEQKCFCESEPEEREAYNRTEEMPYNEYSAEYGEI